MSAFLRGLSIVVTAAAFLLLFLAFDERRVALADRAQLLVIAALCAVGSNAALWASMGFHDAG